MFEDPNEIKYDTLEKILKDGARNIKQMQKMIKKNDNYKEYMKTDTIEPQDVNYLILKLYEKLKR